MSREATFRLSRMRHDLISVDALGDVDPALAAQLEAEIQRRLEWQMLALLRPAVPAVAKSWPPRRSWSPFVGINLDVA